MLTERIENLLAMGISENDIISSLSIEGDLASRMPIFVKQYERGTGKFEDIIDDIEARVTENIKSFSDFTDHTEREIEDWDKEDLEEKFKDYIVKRGKKK